MHIKQPHINRIASICLIVAVGALTYLNARWGDFLSLDDASLLDTLQSSAISHWALFFSGGGDYFRPLTYVSYIFDYHFFGYDAAGFHLTNVALHLLNGLLVYFL